MQNLHSRCSTVAVQYPSEETAGVDKLKETYGANALKTVRLKSLR